MTTQLKETKYYVFWTVAMVAFIVPQILAAFAYHKIADHLNQLYHSQNLYYSQNLVV